MKRRKRKTILIIEDEIDISSFVARVLELEGYDVLQAGDGEKGIMMAGGNRLSLVLLDIRLPGCNGWEVLSEFNSEPALSGIPVVMLTASAAESQQEKALGMGAAGYLVKPLSAGRLRKAVANVLSGVGVISAWD
ncbi:response regulator [Chloroflexota bacterium]